VQMNNCGAEPLRVALVGAGSMGMNHLRVLNDFTEDLVRLVGVADTDSLALAEVVRRFRVPRFADYRQMLRKVHPDLVSVVVPTQLHYEVSAYALEQGANVLIEKPITRTVDEALSLIQLAKGRGRTIAVGHIERFNPAVIALKQLLAGRSLGRIYCLHTRRLGPFPPRIRDVGVALDLATHDLDVMRYLVGTEVERAYAEIRDCTGHQHEDLLFGVIRFQNGVVGMLDVNWLTPTKVRELSVTGECGMYSVNYLTQELYFYENDYTPVAWDTLQSQMGVSEGTMTRLKLPKREPLRVQYEDVLMAVRHDKPPTVTAEDAVAILRLAHLLMESTRAGEVVACRA
jgi:UDP-N-acetylglucosamine 3-dehydrogenase